MDALEWVAGAYVVLGVVVAMARCEYDYGFLFVVAFWPLFVKDTWKDLL